MITTSEHRYNWEDYRSPFLSLTFLVSASIWNSPR
jgi:hypothetical protein